MYKINEQNEVPIFYADEPEPEYGILPKLNENPEIAIVEGNDNKERLAESHTIEGSSDASNEGDGKNSEERDTEESAGRDSALISIEPVIETGDNEATADAIENDHHSDKIVIKNKKDKKTKKKHTLCKLVKKDYIKEHFSDYQALVSDPEYICKKCGRAAKDAVSLCKPLPITKQNEETQNS